MSAERMIATAMQEQPLFLLPVLVFIFLIMRGLARVAHAFSANASMRKRYQ